MEDRMLAVIEDQLLGHLVRIAEVRRETGDAVSLVLDVPVELASRFEYTPGQFLTLAVPSDQTGRVARCYSLSSCPAADEAPMVTIKRTNGGYASNWICDHAAEGLELRVLPPGGTFSPHDLSLDFLLFAAGSGITPAMSIIKSVLAQTEGTVALFYANRDSDSVIFSEELRDLADQHPDRLELCHWYESEAGLPTAESISAFVASRLAHEVYVCGPAPFMGLVERTLVEAGADRHRLHIEEYVSLSGDPFIPVKQVEANGASAEVEVSLDGETHQLGWPESATLIEVLVSAGIDAPYSCREGECGSCLCRLVEGEVRLGRTDALEPDDIEGGYILGCQSWPTSDRLRVEF
jgi:3-ketosteroid 9alpha-monooxygenase subunit B